MVRTALGLLAAGDLYTPLRALVYLTVSQLEDGGFPQNVWINGRPHWRGIQLDKVAFPILLHTDSVSEEEDLLLRNLDAYFTRAF